MRTVFLLALFLLALAITVNAQDRSSDSLMHLLKTIPEDSNRVRVLLTVASAYYFSKPDSCLLFSEEALNLARKLHLQQEEVMALSNAGESLRFLGDYPRALKMQMDALALTRKLGDLQGEAGSLGFIGFTYVEFREYREGLRYLLAAWKINKQISDQLMETFDLTNIGNAYDLLNMPDSALYYQRLAYRRQTGLNHGPLKSLILTRYGSSWASLGQKDSASHYFHRALQNALLVNDRVNPSKIRLKIARLHESLGQYDSSLYYARQAFLNGKQSAQSSEILEVSNLLIKLFRHAKNPDSAFYYQDIANTMTDRIYGPKKIKELQLIMLEKQQQEQAEIQEVEQFKTRIWYGILLSVLAFFFLLAVILYRNNLQKQKANSLLKEQNDKIEYTLKELESKQAMLIQSEKMASLGELTAGIAHEIQNPLNFVNNFSEVNAELITEMKADLAKGHIEEAKSIAHHIDENEKKILFHGKRADAIVKGMLQHSRSSSGVKEPTDINALADEYLRLAYHGLRAKDKSLSAGQTGFNATMKTDLDPALGNVSVIPQDIGRVILNLITNAFYAVDEKKKQQPNGYEPTVSISTKKVGNKAEIRVKDNGNGIPQKVLDKIFQPFFTTKPTGQGTGLGLSLSYDIVKAHGGEIKVETREARPDDPVGRGEGTEFIIELPVV